MARQEPAQFRADFALFIAEAYGYIALFSEFQRASTFVPTEPMTAIDATTIRPAIKAYSRTSPPRSSRINFDIMVEIRVMSASSVAHPADLTTAGGIEGT